MTKKKSKSGVSAKPQPVQKQPEKRSIPRSALVIGVIVVAVIVVLALAGNGAKGGGTKGADPAEAKYIGRLLPQGYEEPKLAPVVTYNGDTPMTLLTASEASETLSLSKQAVLDAKIVKVDYTRTADGKNLPLIAYVKPSGKLFVGVSFCPPCEGEGQTITSDLNLTCDSCGTKRTLESGVGVSGSCKLYPLDELPVKIDGGDIVVEKSLIENWTPQPLDRQVG